MTGVELYAERKRRHRRTWTLAAIVLGAVFMIGGQLGALLPAMAMGFVTLGGDAEGWPQLAYELAAAFGLGSVLVLLWVWLFERRGPAALGLNARGPMRFVRGYLIGLAFLLTVVGVIWIAGGYVVEGAGAFGSAAAGAALLPIGVLMLGFIIQGSSEELLFRGWLMQLIASRHGLWLAVIGNSALFALAHAGNIEPSKELYVGLANIVLFGLFISLYAVREGSLWGVCGWHAAWNWLLGLGFGLEVSGTVIETTPLITDLTGAAGAAWWLTGGDFGPEASFVTTAVLLVGTVVLIVRGRTRDHGVEAAPVEV
ncbi:MAG: type II CAAX endopeptidase family protein [Brevundimonas sp.]|uniref:CPBP family intramembrane glutamic endopeptidase n=1 Tax=Brevundimonas sp. TaxID=1871086 RepID=UPI00260D858B|nr:type II CAAX endopeptidase family protein [Brevundimonas sp.]MDI6623451.1 type II CAAX endopeptidase family protein [Brevundimonas sp.]MDQ7811734.1 type II CAAX endopeptidase family protein [Brevundimonas sp.]